jgi:hydrogenase expression/formation protein HypE
VGEPRIGKLTPSRMKALLFGAFGAPSEQILVGPGPGLDAAVLDMADGRVMAVAEDPIFPAAGLPLEIMGEFTVHIGASDVAVTGIKPEFMTYTLLLPPESPDSDAEILVRSISKAAESLGIAIVGGHTGWYSAVTLPIVGGVTVWGYAPRDRWVSPAGSKYGDVVLMSKGPAVEASALLAVLYRTSMEKKIHSRLFKRLLRRTHEITVVADALSAFEAGGVHAMHDATEGGVLGGLWEMADASGLSVHVDIDGVKVPGDIAKLSSILKFDPWQAISEGTLLVAVDPAAADRVLETWKRAGIEGFHLGSFGSSINQSTIRRHKKILPLPEPGVDPFWALFFAGLEPSATRKAPTRKAPAKKVTAKKPAAGKAVLKSVKSGISKKSRKSWRRVP